MSRQDRRRLEISSVGVSQLVREVKAGAGRCAGYRNRAQHSLLRKFFARPDRGQRVHSVGERAQSLYARPEHGVIERAQHCDTKRKVTGA